MIAKRASKLWWIFPVCAVLLACGVAASVSGAASADAPVAENDRFTTLENRRLAIKAPGVLRNDDVETGISVTRLAKPRHGKLTLNANGSFVYTPNKGYSGRDSFTYKLDDGAGGVDEATVRILVRGATNAPVARDDNYRIGEDGTLTVPVRGVLKNDTGDRVFTRRIASPRHGSLDINRNGSFVYTPDADYDGKDYFTYRNTRKDIRSNAATVIITVNSVNDAPVFTGAASNTSQTIDEGENLAALEATDADGDDLTFERTGGALPLGITLANDGGFAGAAGSRAAGNYTANIKVSDGNGESATTELAVTVNQVDAASVADDADVSTDEDTAKTITLSAADADTDNLSVAVGSNPSHGTLGAVSTSNCSTLEGTATCTATVLYTPDADYNGPDSFTFTAGDSAPATVRITVNPVNDAPVANDDTKTTSENTPLRFPAADLLANDSEGAANENAQTLTVTEVNNPQHGTVDLQNGEITFTPQTDYNGPASFDYTVCDDGSPQRCSTQTAKVNVTVSPVNSAPVAQNDARAMDEDGGPIQIDLGALVSDVETPDANLAYTIVSGPTPQQGDLSGNGPVFDFDPAGDFNGTVEISYKVTDRGDPDNCGVPGAGCDAAKESDTKTVTVTVEPVNDPPANITLSNSSVNENEPSGTLVGILSSTDPDAGDTHSYALVAGTGSNDNNQFTLSGDTLETAARFDKEAKSSYTVRIRTTDGANETFEKALAITVSDVNEAPTDITLSSSSVSENEPSGTAVGALTTTDEDGGETFTYTLVPGTGSDDNGKFQVSNDKLVTAERFDYETKSNYTVRVRSTDSRDHTTEKAFAIAVTDANDAPTANDDTGATDEDTTLNVAAPGVLGNDADQDAGDTTTVGKLNGSTTLTGTSAKGATVTIDADGSYTYDPGSVFQDLLTGQEETDTFTYAAKDGGNLESGPATVTITITGITDPPRITSGGTLSYTENDPPTPVHGALDVTHPEGAQIAEATVEITGNYRSGEDVLAFSDNDAGDAITLGPGSTAKTLTLTGVDSAANYQAALRAVTYENTSEDPSDLTRTVTFTATDLNSTASAPATRDIAVTPVDDPPVAVNDSETVLEDAAATNVPVLDNDTDVDGGAKTISAASDPTNGAVVLTGGSPGAHEGLTYQPDANHCNDPPASNLDTFTYTLNGGDTATVSMTVTCVNDAPVADDETFNGNSGAIGNTSLIVNDPDDGAPSPTHPKKTISGDILAGDTDIDGPGPLTVTSGTFATNDGGSVTIESDGDFTFHPAASTSCTDTSDFFDYTVKDLGSPEQTDTGRVTIAIAGCVWYVSNSATGNSGNSAAPFDTIAQAETASGNNHTVFVLDGDNTSTGYGGDGYAMNAGERLIGEHEGLTVDPDGGGSLGADTLAAPNAGAHPTLTANNADVIDLDDGNELRGINIDPQGTGGGVAGGSGDAGGGTIDDVNIVDNGTAGTQAGFELDSTTGTFNVSNLVVNSSATGVRLHNTTTPANAVNAVFAPAGQISIQSNGGPGLRVNGTSAVPVNLGTSTFDDVTVIGSNNGGVTLSNVSGTTNLGDGTGTDLNLTTTSGAAAGFFAANATNLTVGEGGTDDVHATGGPAVDVNASTATLDFDDVDSTGSTTEGVNLDGLGTGTFSADTGDIDGASAVSFDVNGGSGNITYPGNLNNGPGSTAEITNRNGGSVTLSGPINDSSDAGGGISLGSNTAGSTTISNATKTLNTVGGDALTMTNSDGHTLTLSGGGLDIDTTDGKGLEATTSGTLVVTGSGNTINTTTGRALNVTNTDIGSNDLTFQSISANGANNGIVLNNTGSSGELTVTGNGGTCGSAATCTGGAIQNTTGDGVSLTSTRGPSFSHLFVKDTGGHGISGTGVVNFTLAGSRVEGAGDADNETGLFFATVNGTNLTGSASITNTVVHAPADVGSFIQNYGGTLKLTVSGSTFSGTQKSTPGVVTGDDLMRLVADGTPATITASFTGNTFDRSESDGIAASAVSSPGSGGGTLNLTADGNTFTGDNGGSTCPNGCNDNGFQVHATQDGTIRFTIQNNNIQNQRNEAIAVVSDNTADVQGTIQNNTIGTAATSGSGSLFAQGIFLAPDDNADLVARVHNNLIRQTFFQGIWAEANDGSGGTPTMDVILTNNTTPTPADTSGTVLGSLEVWSTTKAITCAKVENNTAATGVSGGGSIELLQFDTATFKIEGLPAPTNNASAYVASKNPASSPVNTIAATTFTGGTCRTPAATPTP